MPIPVKIVKKGKNRFIAMRVTKEPEAWKSIPPSGKKKSEYLGIKKAMWKKIVIVAISLYIGWSWAKISDQDQIIKLQQKVLTAESSTALNPQ
jgi:hypothetical protein